MAGPAEGITADGVLIGAASAEAAVNGQDDADTPGWQPGSTGTAKTLLEQLGARAVLAALLGGEGSGGGESGTPPPGTAGDMAGGYFNVVARVLAGWDPDVAADELTDMLTEAVADGAYAEALTATTINVASGQAALSYYLANTTSLVSWITERDARVCVTCLANEAQGPIPAGTPFPSGDTAPPAHPQCVIGSTRVSVPVAVVAAQEPSRLSLDPALSGVVGRGDARLASAAAVAIAERDFGRGNIRAVSDRNYVGEIVTIRTALGHELTATPNHPVATRRGWVPITELKVGDHVLSSTAREWEPAAVDPDVDNVPPCIKDVAQAFPVLLGPVPASPEDFHGDGAGSDVYVVRADRLLVDDVAPGTAEHVGERQFGGRDIPVRRADLLEGNRAGREEFGGLGLSPYGVVGGLGERLARLGVSAAHAGVHSLTAPAGLDARAEQPSADPVAVDAESSRERLLALAREIALNHGGFINGYPVPVAAGLAPGAARDAAFNEPVAHALVADTEGFTGLLEALASEITADEVVDLRRTQFAGHVYNLDTVGGWYIGNGIVTHNCRCAIVPDWLSGPSAPVPGG